MPEASIFLLAHVSLHLRAPASEGSEPTDMMVLVSAAETDGKPDLWGR